MPSLLSSPRRASLAPLLSLSALLAVATSSCDGSLLPCVAASDCGDGKLCQEGKCVVACNVAADCGAGEACSGGVCIAEGEGEGGEGEAGEGEGDGGEGEGDVGEGEGEGDAGEGEGEGEGDAGEGEGEPVVCGDGVINGVEGCDDNNTNNGDGCSSFCQIDNGFVCREEPSVCAQLPARDACPPGTDPFLGDLNGDCLPDLVVGSPLAGTDAVSCPGGCYLVMVGQLDGATFQLSPLLPLENTTSFGARITTQPDKGLDSQRAFVVGDPVSGLVEVGTIAGATLTFGDLQTGASGLALVVAPSGRDFEGDLLLSALAPGPDHILFGAASPPAGQVVPFTGSTLDDAALGVAGLATSALEVATDEDGDGIRDILVGSPGTTIGGVDVGAFFISTLTKKRVGRQFNAPAGSVGFGETIANLGDVDGDDIDDLGIGAPEDGPGRAFLALSSRAGLVEILAPAGVVQNARFGASIAPLGDLDGDGDNEILIGAPFDDGAGTADVAECDTLRGKAIAGDCRGSLHVVASSTITAAATVNAAVCDRQGSDGARFGSAIRPLGRATNNAGLGQRVAVSMLGLPSAQPGVVLLLGYTAINTAAAEACVPQAAAGAGGAFFSLGGDPTLSKLLGAALR